MAGKLLHHHVLGDRRIRCGNFAPITNKENRVLDNKTFSSGSNFSSNVHQKRHS